METSKPTTKRYIHIIALVMIVFFVISFITNILKLSNQCCNVSISFCKFFCSFKSNSSFGCSS